MTSMRAYRHPCRRSSSRGNTPISTSFPSTDRRCSGLTRTLLAIVCISCLGLACSRAGRIISGTSSLASSRGAFGHRSPRPVAVLCGRTKTTHQGTRSLCPPWDTFTKRPDTDGYVWPSSISLYADLPGSPHVHTDIMPMSPYICIYAGDLLLPLGAYLPSSLCLSYRMTIIGLRQSSNSSLSRQCSLPYHHHRRPIVRHNPSSDPLL